MSANKEISSCPRSEKASVDVENQRQSAGLNVPKAAFFMIAQMAGAGFLALPRAIADVGWFGIGMLFIFGGSVAFAATRMGFSWVLLEERYPEYKKPARQPYQEIAYRALGPIGKKIAATFMLATNIGSTTVYIILSSELLNSLFPVLSICEFAIIVAFCLIPLTWLGTPKDFWLAPVFAVISTLVAIVVIVVTIALQYGSTQTYPPPSHSHPTLTSFALGFGAIFYSFGGMAVFPTIQNDMKDRSQFWKSVIIAFSTILCMYLPICLTGYILIGDAVNSNVILSLEQCALITVAIVFEICNLAGSYIIVLSPVFQFLDDTCNIPPQFCIKRVVVRSCVVLCELFIALAFPDFGLVVNLIGGSAMCFLSFILPPVLYMRLVDDKSVKEAEQRKIPLWERFYLWEIFVIGIVGGLAATVASLYGLLSPESFAKSCFVKFTPEKSL